MTATKHKTRAIKVVQQMWIGLNTSRDRVTLSKNWGISEISIYTLSDLGVLSNLIGSLSLANEHYSPPTE